MKRAIPLILASLALCILVGGDAEGRGFGGLGGLRGGLSSSFSSFRSGSLSGLDRSADFSSYRSADTYSGWRGGLGATSSYDRTLDGSRGGSLNVQGTRGVAAGPLGGVTAGGTRDVTATGAEGRTYSSTSKAGAAVGPYGRAIGGSEHTAAGTGPGGSFAASSRTAVAGTRFPTDLGLAHYSSFSATGVAGHSTTYWSTGTLTTRASSVRTSFGYYNTFRPAWYTAHPGCWTASAWAANTAWRAAAWSNVAAFCSLAGPPVDFDYGNSVVYINNNVYVNGQNVATAPDYAQQATALADQGQKADAPPTQQWEPLGVFALVQGDDKTSNNIFQLAVNKDGVIRGNYYDGLMDVTTPVYGSVNKQTQRAAWTIGKNNNRVFDAGVYNLTQAQAPVLVHIGTDRTQQWLLVRVQQPKDSQE